MKGFKLSVLCISIFVAAHEDQCVAHGTCTSTSTPRRSFEDEVHLLQTQASGKDAQSLEMKVPPQVSLFGGVSLAPNHLCDSGGARFTEPVVVDLSQPEYNNDKYAHMKRVLTSALNFSYPVLIRGDDQPGPLQADGFEIIAKFCNTSKYPLKDMTRAYAPMSNLWGQMRSTSDKDIEDLLRLLPQSDLSDRPDPTTATIADFVKLVTRHSANVTSANLAHIQASTFYPAEHCPSLHEHLLKEGWEPSYWKLPGWRRKIRYLFVQPAGSAMAAHIDGGKSYFLVHVHRGRKVVYLWPVYSRVSPLGLEPPNTGQNEIESWMLSQKSWPKSADPLVHIKACGKLGAFKNPCDPFLKGAQSPYDPYGNKKEARVEAQKGGTISSHTPGPQYGRGVDAHQCFIKVELGAGDQIFVPSDTPHAIQNLEPTLATGINYEPTREDPNVLNY